MPMRRMPASIDVIVSRKSSSGEVSGGLDADDAAGAIDSFL
jgi:hypothetical protein